jgi:peptidoglycan/xylan/chitin deacetylase (PgdA/CDA1 family)/ketosteroid isomerase-like protein
MRLAAGALGRVVSAVVLVVAGRPTATLAADPTAPRPILISVDDLPIGGRMHASAEERSRTTEGLLTALRKHKIRAVGLVTWGNAPAESDRALLGRWIAEGHELGNHTTRHLNYSAVTIDEYLADVEDARARLVAFLEPHGKTLRFFRFPFLREGDTPEKLRAMRDWLARTGQRNLPVTIDDQDWSYEERWVNAARKGDPRTQDEVRQDYLASLRVAVRHHEETSDDLFGRPVAQILLLHANAVGAANWDALFTWLESTGHRFASADEVLADPAFSESQSVVARFGYGLWDRIGQERRERQVREQVTSLLQRQAEAWNRGDMEAFCAVYAEDAAFANPTGLFRGRAEVLERYKTRYPDAAARGTLSFEVLETRPLAGVEVSYFGDAVPSDVHGVSLLARWTLAYPGKPAATGLTLLVFRPRGKEWEIVQDASM